MDKKFLLILAACLMIFSSLGSVEATLGNFVRGDCVEIKTISNSSFVNLSSLSFPNGTVAITNTAMNGSGKTFNITFCDTQVLGTYIYDFFDAEGNVFVNNFLISPIGDAIETGDSIVYIIILVTIFFFFIFFFFPSVPK